MKSKLFKRFSKVAWNTIFCVLSLTLFIGSNAWAQDACVNGNSSWTLFAGQAIDSGTVSAEVVGSNLEVLYTTTNGWELTEAHLWVGSTKADMPQTRKGSPIPGRFPYNSGDITGVTSHTLAFLFRF